MVFTSSVVEMAVRTRTQVLEEIRDIRKLINTLDSEMREARWSYEDESFPALRKKDEELGKESASLTQRINEIHEAVAQRFLYEKQKYGGWSPELRKVGGCRHSNIRQEVLDGIKKEVDLTHVKWHVIESIVGKIIDTECMKDADYVFLVGKKQAIRAERDKISREFDVKRTGGSQKVREKNLPKVDELEKKIDVLWVEHSQLESMAKAKRKPKVPDGRLNASSFEYTDSDKEEKNKQLVADKVLAKVKL
jgi:hypothetical protein